MDNCGICGSPSETLEDMHEGDNMLSCTNRDCAVQGGIWTADEWKKLVDACEALEQLNKLKKTIGYKH